MTDKPAVDCQAEVHITTPPEAVSEVMFDPQYDAIWTTGVVECTPEQEGPLVAGAAVVRVSKFLGRRMNYRVVVENAGEGFVEMSVKEPFPIRVRYEIEPGATAGTSVARIRTQGGGTGFYRLAAPMLTKMVRRSIQNDLENLKAYLESGAHAAQARD